MARVSDDLAQFVEIYLVEVLYPAAILGHGAPHGVRVDPSLDELLPQLTVRDDTRPLFGDEFGGTK